MFTELLPLAKERTLMLTIAGIGDDILRVNVIPQRRAGKDGDAGENAMASPLTITGTAEELDRDFAQQISNFRASLERLKSNLGEIESAHAAALKSIEEERKKELNSKKKAAPSAAAKRAVPPDSESPSPANQKSVFGSKPPVVNASVTQSLFDSEPTAEPIAQQARARPAAG